MPGIAISPQLLFIELVIEPYERAVYGPANASAISTEEAVAYANYVASRRGDTKDVGKFKPFIICYMPELVKVKPNKQHGDGNKLLKDIEGMICNTDSSAEAGLLAVAMCMANM